MPWMHQLCRASIRRRGALPWGVALGLFASSLAIRVALEPYLAGMKFITFYPAIVIATLVCGWRQGALVVILSALAGWRYYLEPYGAFVIKDATTVGAIVGFLFVSGFLVVLVAALREAVQRVDLARAAQQTLFSELQHRVANNLQLVVSLLRNARRNLRDPVAAAETLSEAEDRIMAMSQLHRRLHDGTAYAQGLAPLLEETLANAFRNLPVVATVEIRGAPDLSIDQMTAITLLVNEAALNAAKHVFSKGLGAAFDVDLWRDEAQRLHLTISDDGPGMASQEAETTRSLGMGIMQAFATQLGGTLEVAGAGGTSLSVRFNAN